MKQSVPQGPVLPVTLQVIRKIRSFQIHKLMSRLTCVENRVSVRYRESVPSLVVVGQALCQGNEKGAPTNKMKSRYRKYFLKCKKILCVLIININC